MLAGGSLNEALRELLRRGLDGRPGLDELRRPGPPDAQDGPAAAATSAGTLDQVRAALDQALAAERDTLAGRGRRRGPAGRDGAGDAAGRRGRGGPGARRLRLAVARGPCGVRVDPGDAPARGARRAVRRDEAGADAPATRRRCRPCEDMLADLNALLAAHARGEDTTDQFHEFMDKHGDLFPEEPEDVDELIDALARRQAAAAADDGLAQPGAARAAGPADERRPRRRRPGLGDGPARRTTCGRCGPGWTAQPGRACSPAGSRSATARRSRRWPSSPTWRRSSSSWPRATPARRWTTSTSSCSSSGSAPARRATCEALRELERELEQQGYLSRGDDGLRLTPRAVRRLGETALKRVFAQLDASRPRRPRGPPHRLGRRARPA